MGPSGEPFCGGGGGGGGRDGAGNLRIITSGELDFRLIGLEIKGGEGLLEAVFLEEPEFENG